jgi:single-stranded-DNA-specific exonuclease
VFKEQHFRFNLEDARGRRVYGVAWKLAHRLPPVGAAVDLAVQLAWNNYNDRKLLQMELLDWRPGGESARAVSDQHAGRGDKPAAASS